MSPEGKAADDNGSTSNSVENAGLVAQHSDVSVSGRFVAVRDMYFNNVTFLSEDGTLSPVETAPGDASDVCPYPGLKPYDKDTAEFFHGREADVTAVLELLQQASLVALVGSSGSGKSSLLSAGVLPALAGGAVPGSANWKVLRLRPGLQPIEQLAERISSRLPGTTLPEVATAIRADPLAFVAFSASVQPANGVLWVIDQLEEIFHPAVDPDTRATFLAALSAAIAPGGLKVIVALRSDFYVQLDQAPELAVAVASAQHRLVRLGPQAIRDVVEKPAEQVGLSIEPELVEQILTDVGSADSALPLLSYALEQSWRKRRGNRLTLTGYHQAGALDGAIDRAAETVWASLNGQQRATTRRVMLRLSYLGEGSVPVRRQVHLADLITDADDAATVIEVVNRLAAARIVTVDLDLVGGSATVDITHEAVLRAWKLLKQWLSEDRDTKRAQEDLSGGARAWQQHGKDAGYLLSGARLVAVEAARRAGSLTLNEVEAGYLGQSRGVDRRQRLRSRLVAVLAIGLVIAIAVTFVVIRQQRQIAREKVVADALQLAAQSRSVVQAQRDLGALLAVAGARTNDNTVTREAVMDSLASRGGPLAFLLPAAARATTMSRHVTPDGSALVGTADGTVQIVAPVDGRPTALALTGHRIDITALDSAGELVVSGDATGILLVHRIGTAEPIHPPIVPVSAGSRVTAVAISSRQRQLFAATAFGAVERWTLGDEVVRSGALRGSANVIALAVDDDSGQLVAINRDGTLLRWRLSDGIELPALAAPGELGAGLGMRLDVLAGSRLVVVANGHIGTWDLRTGRQLAWASAPGPTAVSSSADPGLVMVGDSTGAITPWYLGTALSPAGPVRYGLTSRVVSLAIIKTYLVGLDERGRVLSWDFLGRGSPAATSLAESGGNVRAAATSSTGVLAMAGVDGTVRVTRDRAKVAEFPLSSYVSHLVWTPGASIIAGTDDGRVLELSPASGAAKTVAIDPNSPVIGLSADRQGIVAAAFADGKVVLSNRPGSPMSLASSATSIAMASAGDTIAVASGGEETGQPPLITVRATGDGFPTRRILDGHTLTVSSLAFSPDGRYLASGSDDTTIRVWSLEDGATIATLKGHTDMVLALAFTPDGGTLASGSQDGTIRLWDVGRGLQVGQPLRYADNREWSSLTPTADGEQLLAADGDSAVSWPFTPRAWVARACHFAGREITTDEWTRLGHRDSPPRLCS